MRSKFVVSLLFLVFSSLASSSPMLNIDPTGASFSKSADDRLGMLDSALEAIIMVKGPRTIENTLMPYRDLSIELSNGFSEASVFANSHPDEVIRDKSFKAIQDLSKFSTEKLLLNRQLYDALVAVKVDKNNKELYRYYDELILSYKRSGVDKDDKTRRVVGQLLQEITIASQTFEKNLQEDVRTIMVKPADLKGLPEDFIKSRLQKNGYVKITTDYPDSGPVFSYAESNAVRLQLYKNSRSRGYPKNVSVMKDLLEKRYKLATLLGYKNWAAYATEDKMVKTPQRVSEFLQQTIKMTKAMGAADYEILLNEKKLEIKDAKDVQEWERSYYTEKYKKRVLSLDSQEVRQYFAFNNVRDGVFKISEKLFGISIKKVEGAKSWHPDVDFYQVFDHDQVIGEFYLDLFPRDNKFKHAAQFTLRNGYKDVQLPIAVLMCNFPRPSATDSALMEHSQVETFLHEFGHLLHSIFSGHHQWPSSLEWDFVEAPSQMLEEWVWDVEALHMFAKNYETGKLIPKELITKMKSAAKVNLGINTLTQLHYASLSLEIYNQNPKNLDVLKLDDSIKKRISPFPFVTNTYFPYGFGHLTGYASNYYTYLWSQVIAKDMFSKFLEAGIFSKDVAMRYRERVLTNSGTESANDLVKDFLGREYNIKAFSDWLSNK